MRVIIADTFTSLFSSQLSSPAIKSRFIGLHYNLFFARASKSICLEFLETGRQANDHQVFETPRGSTRKMNDIAKLTQELEYVRSISNPSHLKPYSKKRGLFQSYYISWVMKKYAMISTLDEASIKKILHLASLGFLFENKNWCNIFALYSDEIQTSVLVFCWFSVARLLNTALEIVVQTWKKCNLLLKLTF